MIQIKKVIKFSTLVSLVMMVFPLFLIPTKTVYADQFDKPHFSTWRQNVGPWKDISLGGGLTVEPIGCYVISEAIQAKRSGINEINGQSFDNPTVFVNYLNAKDQAVGGSKAFDSMRVVTGGKLTRVSEDFTLYGQSDDYKIKKIQEYHDKGYYQIVSLDRPGVSQGHWIAVSHVENGEVYVFDPATEGTKFPLPSGYQGVSYSISSIHSTVTYKSSIKPVQEAEKQGGGIVGGTTDSGDSDTTVEEEPNMYVGEDAWKNKMVNFQDRIYKQSSKVFNMGSNGFINNAFIVGLDGLSIKLLDYAYVAMMVITTAILGLMTFAIIFYLVVLPNYDGTKLANGFTKITGVEAYNSRQNTFDVLGRFGLAVIIITMVYANVIPLFLQGVFKLLSFIF